MGDQGGGSGRGSEYTLLIAVGYADDGSDPTRGSVLRDPISKRLVSESFQLSPAQQTHLIKEILADVTGGEHQAAKYLEPGDASKFIEILDSVRLYLLLSHQYLMGNRF